MKALDDLNRAKIEIGQYFGTCFYEDIEDFRNMYWECNNESTILIWENEDQIEEDPDGCYCEEVISIHYGPEFTAVSMSTCTGDSLVGIFDNSKRINKS